MEKVWLGNLKRLIEDNENQHQILIWGASSKSDYILSVFREWGCNVVGYVDRHADSIQNYNDLPVYTPEKLATGRYFVFVALIASYAEVLAQLDAMGYVEFKDFWYPQRIITLDGTENYEDAYGNALVTQNATPIIVRLRSGGKVEINKCKINMTTKIISEGQSYVRVGEGVRFGEKVNVHGRNGTILIGDSCKFSSNVSVSATCGGKISIGEKSTMETNGVISASFDAHVILGQDCMISYFVLLRAGNSHNMIDLDTLENFDDNTTRDVILGDHVWVGMRATIMNGVEIDSGSTVGANSFVCKRKFPSNCCLAGNPARILREHTAWIRDGMAMHRDIEDYEDFIYSDFE